MIMDNIVPLLIGITGYRRSGKGVAADHLVQHFGFTRFEWSMRLKLGLKEMGVPTAYLFGNRKEEIVPGFGKTARHLMQTLGTEWGRDLIDQDLWVNLSCQFDIDPTLRTGNPVVMEGTRFPNEVQAIKDRGGIIIQINRPGTAPDGHRSEILPAFDYQIENDGTTEELRQKVGDLISSLMPESHPGLLSLCT